MDAVNALSSKMYGLLTSPSSFKGLSEDLMGGNIMVYYTTATSAVFYRGGFVVIKTSSTRYDWNDLKRITSTTTYYWPKALEAYNLTRQVYTVAQAIERGNGNPELRWILNEKMDELKDSLKVYVSESTTETPIKRFVPVYAEPPHQPIGMQSTGSSSPPSAGTGTSVRDTATSHTPTKIEVEALTLDNNEGRLKVDNVLVVVDNVSSSSVSYHVKVTVEAEDNAVSDVEVNLADDTTGEGDSGSLGLITEGSSKSWTSREFTASVSGEGITIHGSVSITYTPSCGPAPTSAHGESVLATCNVPHTITESYSKTVKINTSIDPSKVHFTIRPSRTHVTAGKSVDFNITITNDNNNEISGYYSVKISVPQPNGGYGWASYNDHVSVPAHKTKTLHVTTITYGSPGTSEYYGTFDFGVSSASDSGEVTVIGPSGAMWIEGVHTDPSSGIKAGDTVSFNVLVNNSYSSSKQVELKLFIDGKEVDSASGSVGANGANSKKSFTLHWLAQAGEHSYTVKLYSVSGGVKIEEDERGGKVMVAEDLSTKIDIEVKCPSRVGLGDSFECLLQIKNNNSETVEVQLNNITFWGEVKYEEADINYVRFQWVEGTFYLSAFKEVPPHSSRSIPIDLGRVDDEFASHFGLSDNHRLLSSTVQGDVNPNTIYQVAYWDTEYHLTLRLDVFDKNGNVLLKDKALTASTTLFYQGSTQAKIDRDMRIQRLKEFGENAIKIIVLIVTISYSKDKLWEFVKGFWG